MVRDAVLRFHQVGTGDCFIDVHIETAVTNEESIVNIPFSEF